MNNWREYLIALLANILTGFLLSINCEGERCLIIILAFSYCVIAAISYLPYLFYKPFKEINNEKILAFFFPSLLMFIAIFLWLKFGSNMSLGSHNILSIGLAILPNTILQLILFLVTIKKRNA
ncbi:hypothetical protein D7035_20000, partial [Aquimarina sp. AD1]